MPSGSKINNNLPYKKEKIFFNLKKLFDIILHLKYDMKTKL